ncbi:unnamed protein product [Ectocarpus fasciculatus]
MSTSSAAAAAAVAILPAKAPLPLLDDGLTVVSFNVLLPNGNDGWWMYKSYQPHVPEEHRVWPFRKALMREYLLSKDADIVCIQEASAETFETDFDFMKDAGYDYVLHTKFRFRSATFFKTSRLELASEKHKDRVLVTGLRTLPPATGVPSSQATPSHLSPPPPPGTERTEEQEPSDDADPSNPGGSPAHQNPSTAAGETAGITHLRDEGCATAGDGGGASSSSDKGRLVMVVNCHLTGGPAPERRMRQVLDGLDAARKDAAKLLSEEAAAAAAAAGKKKGGGGGGKKKGGGGAAAAAPGTSVPVVVCGDLNSSNGRTAVCELLSTGLVEASFRERGYPETAITSKDKRHGFGPFGDVYEEAYGDGNPAEQGVGGGTGGEATTSGPPPTFLVPLLHPHFLSEDGEGVSPRLRVALSEAFRSLVGAYGNTARAEDNDPPPPPAAATGDPVTPGAEAEAFLPREGVEAWLMKINRSLGRGSEFRAAEAIMGPGPGGGLTLEDFCSIYASELRGGKFWGVAHDLHALGVELPGGVPWVGPYTARFDRVFYSKATLEAVGAMEPLCEEERELVAGGDCLPNSWHPSDHLAVAGAFRFR